MKSCINCEKRYPGCHAECQDYAAEKETDRIRKEKIKINKDREKQGREYVYDHYHKQKR